MLRLLLIGLLAFCSVGCVPDRTPGKSVPKKLGKVRVLIVEESGDRVGLPSAQRLILHSGVVADWCKAHCSAGQDDHPEFRVLDKDSDMSLMADHWKSAMAVKRDSVPWIVILPESGTKPLFSGPLPKDVDATIKLLGTYGD